MSSRQPSAALTGGPGVTADEEDFDLANASDDGGASDASGGAATPAAYDSAEEDAAAEVRSRWVGCWWVRARAPYGRRASSVASELLLNPMRRRKERGEETRTAHPLSLIHLTPRLSRQANLGNSSLVEIRRREKQRIRAAAKARADALKKLKEEEDRKFASDDVSRRGQGVAHRG
jgi:hypothetical protein